MQHQAQPRLLTPWRGLDLGLQLPAGGHRVPDLNLRDQWVQKVAVLPFFMVLAQVHGRRG